MTEVAEKKFQGWIVNYVFSPSSLESYLLCPYRFYAQYFLKLAPEIQWEVEMTPAETGQILHRILEQFLLMDKKSYTEKNILAIMEDHLSAFQKNRPNLSQVLLEHHKKKISRTLLTFLEQDIFEWTHHRTLVPRHLEWSFGRDGSPPLLLPDGQGGTIALCGRIDRIDVDEASKRFLVIDYKTGSTKTTGSKILAGDSLQLPLYILAVQKLLLPSYEPIGGLYYHLSDMSKKDGLLHADRLPEFLEIHPRSSSLVPGAKWDAAFQKIEDRVREIVAEIRKGVFPSHHDGEPCEPYCAYQDICRIRSESQITVKA